MSEALYVVADVRDALAAIPDGYVDLVITSPPFLALRSYLPADHPDKHREIGAEPTPAAFLDTLLCLTAEWGRVLAPHGSLCVELGDTYAGSGGAGGDYNPDGLRDGQAKFSGSATKRRANGVGDDYRPPRNAAARGEGGLDRRARQEAGVIPKANGRAPRPGWPMDKSLTLIPELYRLALAYGMNPLTGQPSPAGRWRIRNVVRWVRPNPPVGALGDKWRPATSEMVVACRDRKRFFDLDATRQPSDYDRPNLRGHGARSQDVDVPGQKRNHSDHTVNAAGAPPLDWSYVVERVVTEMLAADASPKDIARRVAALGDEADAWEISPGGYRGAHFAVFPPELLYRPIDAMCPQRVCVVCGKPSERIVDVERVGALTVGAASASRGINGGDSGNPDKPRHATTTTTTTGWTDCGHDAWRRGRVLDPFAGSGTTLQVATGRGRDAIGIDLDARNLDLARERCGMFLREATLDELAGLGASA